MKNRFRSFAQAVAHATYRTHLYLKLGPWKTKRVAARLLKFFLAPLGILKLWSIWSKRNQLRRQPLSLGIVLIAKNEAPYLPEWIKYHQLLGVQRFYIYDNESTDNLTEVLAPFVKTGLVKLRPVKGKKRQNDVYNDALNRYRDEVQFMAFIDADEFIFAHRVDLITELAKLMPEKADKSAVGLNWAIFGSNHLTEKPNGLVIKNYTARATRDFAHNYHIKSIVDPRRVISFYHNPHVALLLPGYYLVAPNGEVLQQYKPIQPQVIWEPIRLNHYFSKSRDEFMAKRARGMATHDNRVLRSMADFELHDRNEEVDTGMLPYCEKVEKALDNEQTK